MKKTGWKKIRFQMALNKTFCTIQPPLIHRRFKHRQRTKTKQCFLPPLHRFPTQSSQYQYWKASKYSILTVVELRPSVSESSTGSQTFYTPTDSEHKFHKTGIENWLPIGFNLAFITTTLWSTTNGKNLKVLYTHP